MRDLIKYILNIIGWVLLIISFSLYFRYQDLIGNSSRAIILLANLILLTVAIGLILLRSYGRVRRARREATPDKVVRITPLDEFKHDAIALLTAGLIILAVYSSNYSGGLNRVDFFQAGIGFLGVITLRKIYLK